MSQFHVYETENGNLIAVNTDVLPTLEEVSEWKPQSKEFVNFVNWTKENPLLFAELLESYPFGQRNAQIVLARLNGQTHKKIVEDFQISESRVGQIVEGYLSRGYRSLLRQVKQSLNPPSSPIDSIYSLYLPEGINKKLIFNGIETVSQLIEYTEDDLLKSLTQFSFSRLNQVKLALRKKGMTLKEGSISEVTKQKERKFSVHNLIGWDDFIPEGKTKSQIVGEMENARKVYLEENNELDWEMLLAPTNFDPEKLLDDFTALWNNKKYSTHINCFEINDQGMRSVIVIKEEDNEAYEIVSAMHGLLPIDQFINVTG